MIHTDFDNNNNQKQENYLEIGYPVNISDIGKSRKRTPRWTLFSEWVLMKPEDAIAAHMRGCNVIWSFVRANDFNESIRQFNSGDFKTKKGKNCDARGCRTIDDRLIDSSDTVLLDVDLTSFNNTPSIIKENAWIYYPSASVESVKDGDIAKMHYLYKMPFAVTRDLIKTYRQIFLELLTEKFPDFKYDHSVVTPKWEFYGKNPEFNDQSYFKRDDSKVIPLKLHTEIIELAETRIKEEKKANDLKYTLANNNKNGKNKKDTSSLSEKVDNHLIEKAGLEAIANGLFGSFDWGIKHHSLHTFEQWETKGEMFNPDASSGDGLSLYQSDRTGRILTTYKGTNKTINLYEFYARYKIFLKGEDCWVSDVKLNGGNFKKLVAEITEKLEIEPFQFDNNHDKSYDDFLPNYVKCYGDKSDKSTFFYYDYFQNIWTHTLSPETLIRRCLAPIIEENTGKDFEESFKELDNLARKVIKCKPCYGIIKPLQGDADLVGFRNGDYSISKQELLEFSSEHLVFERYSFDFSIIRSDINNRVENVLKKWANAHDNDWEVVRDWFYASFLKMGQVWSSGMFFYGTPGSGKSLMVKSLGLIDEESSTVLSIKADAIASGKHPFSQYTPSCLALYIDDINDVNAPGMNEFYELLTEKSHIEFTAKWVNSMKIKRHSTIAFTSESFPVRFNNQKTGMLRRALGVFVNHGKDGFAVLAKEILGIFNSEESMREWFMWSIANINPADVKERYNQYVNDESRKIRIKAEMSSESTMVQFAEEELVIAENSEDFVIRSEFIEKAKSFAIKSNDQYLQKLPDLRLLKQALSVISQGHRNGNDLVEILKSQINTQGQPKQKRINGILVPVVWGVRLKTSQEIRQNIEGDQDQIETQKQTRLNF